MRYQVSYALLVELVDFAVQGRISDAGEFIIQSLEQYVEMNDNVVGLDIFEIDMTIID